MKWFAILALVMCPAGAAQAAVIRVPLDEPTIQAGLDAATSGDAVLLAPGTYRGQGNIDLSFEGKAVTLLSERGPASCVIDCDGNGRAFWFHNNETSASVVRGITIREGFANVGGAISCEFASPTIADCRFTGNEAGNGAAIFLWGASPEIVNSLIAGNYASFRGGGIDCGQIDDPSCPRIVNCTITGNEADTYGGGVFVTISDPVFSGCILWGNEPEDIYIMSGTPAVDHSTVTGGYPGAGNLSGDPRFVSGPGGDYYLSHVTAGQPADSPCIDAGHLAAYAICLSSTSAEWCLDQLTTSSGDSRDTGQVDQGYHHYAAPGPLELDLVLTKEQPQCFRPDNHFVLEVRTGNPLPVTDGDLYCVLDVYGVYFFHPSWTQDLQAEILSIPAGAGSNTVLDFTWPMGAGAADDLAFYAVLTEHASFDLLSKVDVAWFCYSE
ncbi:DUF1565 domain-containing protein [bacterium]|nr:DUF1565 domain-containing protein [candidate division CSSED10-310 bacterium]